MILIHRSKPLAILGSREIRLTRREHDVLTVLGMMDCHFLETQMIAYFVWGDETAAANVNNKIMTLRHKLGPDAIATKPGMGYRLNQAVEFVG